MLGSRCIKHARESRYKCHDVVARRFADEIDADGKFIADSECPTWLRRFYLRGHSKDIGLP